MIDTTFGNSHVSTTPARSTDGLRRVRVWDAVVRSGHWMMAGGFIVAWLTAESDRLQLVHVGAGAMVFAVAAFRILWGLIGSRHARFGRFVRGANSVRAYLASLLTARPMHTTGHNPAGAIAIVALLALGIAVSVSGWLSYQDMLGEWFEDLHDTLANAMLLVVVVHLAGVLLSGLLHRENLISAMLSGWKRGTANEDIATWRYPWAALMIVWTVMVVVWTVQS